MDNLDVFLDDALDGLPLSPTPPGFTRRVMAEVWRPVVTFRLEFLDLALPAFFALIASILAAGGLYWLLNLDPLVILEWKLRVQLVLLRLSHWPGAGWAAAAACLGAALLALLAGLVIARLSERS